MSGFLERWAAITSFSGVPSLIILVLLAACSTPQTFDSKSAGGLQRIVMVKVQEPERYLVGSNGSSASLTGNGSLLGQIIAGAQSENETNQKFRAGIATQKVTLGSDMTAAIADKLRQDGYQVELVDLPAPPPGEMHKDFTAFKDKGDAVLDLVLLGAGYGYSTGLPYEPAVTLQAELTELKTQRLLYRNTISYANTRPQGGLGYQMLQPTPGYAFCGGGDLIKEPERAAAGLRSSVAPIAGTIGTDLRRAK